MINSTNQRVLENALTFIKNKSTVRKVALITGCSKSTVHKDLTERLPKLDEKLFLEVKELLLYNKETRHIRGGEATKNRFLLKKNKN